ncbi:hypothetical protein A2Y83_02545 [Candidatus Falkowbacteria bacterium RBG_13_39_14]|uniref:Uncharacterized protein n=1 Tax=Candidatus Falkowbacteria bacterium RBG_13_39_14 TaxID=1797985 RepID=A0A1F5S3X2_9BACT|nr:MAG: hypothetical protein A2Y83_02545 [Candidatus Falkowbacteria bacterium RBG_13_39_14]
MKIRKTNKQLRTPCKKKVKLPFELPIKFTKAQIKTFDELGAELIYLYGSYAQGYTHPMSDKEY